MCGIAGFTRFTHSTGNLDTLKAMGQSIFHRGPDAGGEYLDDQVGLCHRRLSIIDLSEAGNQPMYSEDGQLVIVFNGEIYNFQPLREELIAQGYSFHTKTDTEVLLALYQRDGENLLEHINGMFAFALWDKQQQRLFIARDRLGKKPLYYYHHNGYFVFGSELKSILTLPEVPRVIRPDAVRDFFAYQYIPDPKSIFEHIYKLEPGHFLSITAQEVTNQQYWNLSFKHTTTASPEAIAETLLSALGDSTRQRMISDVPLGAFLSGGVDSSAVVALMAENSDTPVTTCAIGFDSKEFDEVEFAQRVAEQFNTQHHEFTVRENVVDNLENIVAFFDEPFADPSLIPTYFVSQLARQKVTVALAGDGGDECFAGYSKYAVDELENRLRTMFPRIIRKHVFANIAGLFKNVRTPLLRKAYTLLNTLSLEPDYGFFLTNSFFREALWEKLVNKDFKQQLGGYHPSQVTTDHYKQADGPDHLSKILYTDFKTYLPGGILVKVDRMSMANSLEVRAPILDYKVVEYAASIPSSLKLNNGDKKHILKQAFTEHLSHDTLYRKKMGFSVPLAQWLRQEIKEQAENTLFGSRQGLADYFDMAEVKLVWQQHQQGLADYSAELWSMLMFQLWFNRYASTQQAS
jgi:asparagine synthase (glutamine-hydrolysing)